MQPNPISQIRAGDEDLRDVYKRLPLDERHALIATLYRRELPQNVIAETLGINASTVSRVLDALLPDRSHGVLHAGPDVDLSQALPEMVAFKRAQDALGRLDPASRSRVLEALQTAG